MKPLNLIVCLSLLLSSFEPVLARGLGHNRDCNTNSKRKNCCILTLLIKKHCSVECGCHCRTPNCSVTSCPVVNNCAMPAKLEVPSIIEVKEQEQQPTVMTSEEKRVMDVLQTSLKEKYSNLVIERVEIVDGQLNLFGSSSDTAADLAVEVGKVLTREKINLTPNLSGLKMPDAQEIPPGVESAPAPPGADSTTTPPTDVDAPPAPSATGNASARPSEGVPPAPNSKAWVARDTLMLVSGLKWSMQFHLSAVGVSADGA